MPMPISNVSALRARARLSTVNLTLSVKGRVHLARIIKRIRNLPNVGKITRTATNAGAQRWLFVGSVGHGDNNQRFINTEYDTP